jgi:hypothetical protein
MNDIMISKYFLVPVLFFAASLLISCPAESMELPVKVKIEFEEPPLLNKDVTMKISLLFPENITMGDDYARLGIPEGFEIVSGNPDWQGTCLNVSFLSNCSNW